MELKEFQKMFADHLVAKGGVSKPEFEWNKDREEEFKNISIERLIDDEYFLNQKDELYPAHREVTCELWSRKEAGEDIRLFLDSGAVGTGKTHNAAVNISLSMLKNMAKVDFQEHYPLLGKNSGLVFVVVSRETEQARDTIFEKIMPLLLKSQFIRDYFPPDVTMEQIENMKRKPDRLRFPNRMLLFTTSGFLGELGAIGYDLIWLTVDEINFLPEIEKSRRKGMQQDGSFLAAEELVNTGLTRIYSRFPVDGKFPSTALVHGLSARRGKNDYLDRKMVEYRNDPQVIMRDMMFWEGKPAQWKGETVFSGDTFDYDTENMEIVDLASAMEKYRKLTGINLVQTEETLL